MKKIPYPEPGGARRASASRRSWRGAWAALILASLAAGAVAKEPDAIRRAFVDPDGRRVGMVWIMNNPDGPDMANMKFERLPPNEGFTVHLAESAVRGSVPTVFVGHFRSDADGNGQLDIRMELYSSYVGVNQGLEDDRGIGRTDEIGTPPGAVANGGSVVPIKHFRVYSVHPSVGGVRSIFGAGPGQIGGGHVASTVRPFGCCRID